MKALLLALGFTALTSAVSMPGEPAGGICEGTHMRIIIETIPHSAQRYETVGDWVTDSDGTKHIYVSEMSDPRYEFLVGIHEAIEQFLAELAGVTEADVDAFDMQYEKDRAAGLHSAEDEPGMDPACPVYREHRIADVIERLIATEVGVDWNKYEDEVESLAQ